LKTLVRINVTIIILVVDQRALSALTRLSYHQYHFPIYLQHTAENMQIIFIYVRTYVQTILYYSLIWKLF